MVRLQLRLRRQLLPEPHQTPVRWSASATGGWESRSPFPWCTGGASGATNRSFACSGSSSALARSPPKRPGRRNHAQQYLNLPIQYHAFAILPHGCKTCHKPKTPEPYSLAAPLLINPSKDHFVFSLDETQVTRYDRQPSPRKLKNLSPEIGKENNAKP